MSDGPAVHMSLQRRVRWADTDASGLWHFAVVCDLVEETETELHRKLGIVDETIGRMPRVSFTVEYDRPASFGDLLNVELRVVDVGGSSLVYEFAIHRRDDLLASGSMTTVFVDGGGRAAPLPSSIREPLVTTASLPQLHED